MTNGTTTAPLAVMTNACPSREALKGYLSGWTDEEDSHRIEEHLLQCGDCEQLITAVESEPDSMAMELEQGAGQTPLDSIVSYALSLAKRQPLISDRLADDGSANDRTVPGKTPLNPPDAPHQSMPLRATLEASEIGPYELIRSLGHGGMGSVYLARHRELDKLVAIKVFPARWLGNDHHQTRFKREIRAAGGLNHAAIVTATDAGQFEDIHYLVMEFIDGLDLSRTTRLCGPLGIADACETMRRVALGLSHAHAAGIVHRDIKPSNLMLSTTGDVKILDFGLARHSLWDEASAELTTVGQLMGTLDYMAPEQAECAAAADYRADLYSLGATLFRLIAGRPPLAAAPDLSPLAKLRLLATSCPPRIDTLRADVPKALVEFIATLLHRSPDQRPPSAAHVAEQLAEFSADHNLIGLAAQAKKKLAASPLADSLPIEPFAQLSSVKNPKLPMTNSRSGSRSHFWKWIGAAVAVPAIILAGILLMVETQKGQLVIESEAENVTIRLLSDGQIYHSVKVVPGATSTRLFAGRYEITIAGAAEDFQIDHQSVEIRRGETTIARIRKAEDSGEPATNAANSNTPIASSANPIQFSDEWVYEGKTLSVWMNQLAVERSPTELSKAVMAIGALTGAVNSDEVVNGLYAILPTIDNLDISAENRNSTVDFDIFYILAYAAKTPDEFYKRLVNELATADTEWAQRLYAGAMRGDLAASTLLIDWIVKNELANDKDPERVKSAAIFVRAYLLKTDVIDQTIVETSVQALRDSKSLRQEFWLEVIPNDSISKVKNPVPLLFLKAMRDKAIEAFTAENTDPIAVAQSAVLLSRFADPMYSIDLPISDQQKQEVSDALSRRLSAMAVSTDTITSTSLLDGAYIDASLPKTRSVSFFPTLIANVVVSSRSPQPTPNAIILLNLANSIQNLGQPLPACESIIRLLEDRVIEMYVPQSRKSIPRSTNWGNIEWPSLSGSAFDAQQLTHYLIYAGAVSLLSESEKEECKQRFFSKAYDLVSQINFQSRDRDESGLLDGDELDGLQGWQPNDLDGDGAISREEHRAMTEKMQSVLDGQSPSKGDSIVAGVDPKYASYAARIVARADGDGDGRLSGVERKDMLMDLSEADSNKDGFITVAECAYFLQGKATIK